MQMIVCKICQKVFYGNGTMRTCKSCRLLDEAYFTRVELYLKEYPNSNAMQISEALDLSITLVVSYINEGRLKISPGYFEQI